MKNTGSVKVFGRAAFPLLRHKETNRLGKAIKLFSFYGNHDQPLWVCDVMYLDNNQVVYTQKPDDWEIVGQETQEVAK
jgi:hypothetical protein